MLRSNAALGDELKGNRNPDAFVEREHSVHAVAHEGYLELTVQRTVENLGAEVDEASIQIDLPDTEVATNLRSKAIIGGRVVWFQGELLDADIAANRYAYLTGYGQALPKDPAWLYWTSPSSLGLQVFPCPPHQPKTVEYRLIAPMPYANGRYSVELSALGSDERHADFELSATVPGHRVWVDQHELFPGSRVRSPANATTLQVELDAAQQALVQGEFAVVDLGTGRSYLRAELRAKPKLAAVPTDAHVIVLFDMSRSVGNTWQSELRLFERLMPQFPNAKFAAWGFDRTARPISERFVSFDELMPKLQAFPKQTRNGSRADLALKAAAELLRNSPWPHERTRIFILSDAEVAHRTGDALVESAIRTLPATVQLADVSDGSCGVAHAPEMRWTRAVEATGGTAWSVSTNATATDCQSELEELARPKRFFVEAVTFEGTSSLVDVPESLEEGQAFVYEAVVNGKPKMLGFESKLWGKVVSRQFAVDQRMSRIRAALATTTIDFDLTDPELRKLAMAGRAVTRLTSYLAIEPGVRPSRDGLVEASGAGQGFGSGHGRIGGSHASRDRAGLNRQGYIEAAVDAARKHCGVGFLRANVELETTLNELVDVVRADVPDAPPSASGCLTERLWELELPAQFHEQRATFLVVR